MKRGERAKKREMQADASAVVKYEKIKRRSAKIRVYRDDRKNSHAVKSPYERRRRRAEGGTA